ncbi:DUF4352 domain-containing protein [Actinoplanes couchii]|uniref:DUF4352 domain-containing protein n=1 Tax=Actinoplanes couchii TaxID=403638 RepID=A0ABQ3X8F9_9ACTN|nr:DUF4352 domain-containing protein [Actinoplanes couchii]MDR6320193.1 hypothetical protein [Actinoplanes couchii]GID54793.1 hypothetical protein Aco03nite_031970 [Actinoplanes couchii]
MSNNLRQRRRPVRAARRPSPAKLTLVVLVSVAVVVLLFAIGIAAEQYNHGDLTATTAAATNGPATAARLSAGKAVRDGQFEFTVTKTDCSRSTVALEQLKRTADGRFCVITLSVRNVGDDDKYFIGQAQTAYDAAGTEYDSDKLAGLYANRGVEAFVQKLSPGTKVTGKLVFDVPKGVELTTLELHDSPLSGGVKTGL